MRYRLSACWLFFGMLTVSSAVARDSCTWNGSVGTWSTGAAWSCGHAPGAADNVVINSGVVTLGSPATVAGYSQTGGELTGPGDLTVTGTTNWSGGSISGSGSLTTQGTAMFWSPTLVDRVWTLEGGGTWVEGHADLTDTATLVVPSGKTLTITSNGGQLRNQGTPPGGAQLVVEGSLTYNRTGGSAHIDVVASFDGPIAVDAGLLLLRRTNLWTSFGDVSVAGPGILDFSGVEQMLNDVQITGAGGVRVTNGSMVTMSNGATITPALTVNSATLTVTEPSTFSSVSLTGGTLTGDADITVAGDLGWSGGQISGSGSLTTQGTVMFWSPTLVDRVWTLEGGGTWVEGHADLTDTATLVVPSGQTLTITTNGGQLRNQGTPPGGAQLVVDGSLTYTRVNGSVYIDVRTENAGTVTAIAGVLRLRSPFQNDGRIQGVSTIDLTLADLANSGTFAPGQSPGVLSIIGNYDNSILEIEVAGSGDYDQLPVQGQATLGGTLDVRLLNDYVPAPASEFLILSASGITGEFDTLLAPDLGPDTEWSVVYGTTDVRLVVVGPNQAPTEAYILTPADGASFVIQGDPNSTFAVTWEAATDADGDALSYSWQIGTAEELSTVVYTFDAGQATQADVRLGDLAAAVTGAGLGPGETSVFHHRVVASDGLLSTGGPWVGIEITRGAVVDVEDGPEAPERFALHAAYPNPFNPATRIRFDIANSQPVRLAVYDMLGRLVRLLVDEERSPGSYEMSFDADGLPGGVYVLRMSTNGFQQTRTMALLK